MSDAFLSPEEIQFRDSVRKFVDKEIIPNATRWDMEEKYPQELFAKAGELGWLGCAFPEEVGGSGGGALMYALLCCELVAGTQHLDQALARDLLALWRGHDLAGLGVH